MKIKIPFVEDLERIEANYKEQNVICPFCKSKVVPVLKLAMTDGNLNGANMRFLAKFPCCNKEYFVICDKTHYSYHGGIFTSSDAKWSAEDLPKEILHFKDVPEIIIEISPNFKSIYEEAQAAKQLGYTQICGGGYRKALEFLLKDYAILLHPDKGEEIAKMELGNCVKQYIDNPTIQIYANRASWLGNDELHYRKTWVDKDIFDLESLIEASILAIKIEEEGKKLVEEMPKPKKK